MHRSRARAHTGGASATAAAAAHTPATQQLRASSAARARRANAAASAPPAAGSSSPPLSSHFRRNTLSPPIGPTASSDLGDFPLLELDLGVAVLNAATPSPPLPSRATVRTEAAPAVAATSGKGGKPLGSAKRKRAEPESSPSSQSSPALQLAAAAAEKQASQRSNQPSSVPISSLDSLPSPTPSPPASARKPASSPRHARTAGPAPDAASSALVASAMDIDDDAAAAKPVAASSAAAASGSRANKALMTSKMKALLNKLESQQDAEAAATSPPSASAAVATPAAKPGTGVPRKPIPTLSSVSRPTPVTQRQLKLSGNDAEHPIELDDAQPSPVVVPNTRKASAAAAANRGGAQPAGMNGGSNHARGGSSFAVSPSSPSASLGASGAGGSLSRSAGSGSPSSSSFHLVYPRSGLDQVVITGSDLALLMPHEFLNDSIIDFGLKHIYQQLDAQTPSKAKAQTKAVAAAAKSGAPACSAAASKQSRFYFFNTFFYTRWLVAEGKRFDDASAPFAAAMARSQSPFAGAAGSSSSTASSAGGSAGSPSPAHSPGYLAVAKWTKRVDIFSRDFLVVPINESTHWSVAIICYPAKFFQPPELRTGEATGKAAVDGRKNGGGQAACATETASPAAAMDESSDPASATAALRSRASARRGRNKSTGSASVAAAAASSSSPTHGFFQSIKNLGNMISAALGGGGRGAGRGRTSAPSPVQQDPFVEATEKEEAEEAREEAPAEPARKKPRVAATSAPAPSPSPTSSPASPLLSSSSFSPQAVLAPDTDPTHVPAILYLDSLLPPPENLYEHLSRYLREEWAAKAAAGVGVPAQRPGWRWVQPPYIGGIEGTRKGGRASVPTLSPFGVNRARGVVHYASDPPLYVMRVPEQQNGCDCGLYLLEYTRRFCEDGLRALEKFMQQYAQQQAGTNGAAGSNKNGNGSGANHSKIHTLSSIASSGSASGSRSGPKFEEIFFQQWNAQFPHQHMNSKRKQLRDMLLSLWRADMQTEAARKTGAAAAGQQP